jgi:hypothetical protein
MLAWLPKSQPSMPQDQCTHGSASIFCRRYNQRTCVGHFIVFTSGVDRLRVARHSHEHVISVGLVIERCILRNRTGAKIDSRYLPKSLWIRISLHGYHARKPAVGGYSIILPAFCRWLHHLGSPELEAHRFREIGVTHDCVRRLAFASNSGANRPVFSTTLPYPRHSLRRPLPPFLLP